MKKSKKFSFCSIATLTRETRSDGEYEEETFKEIAKVDKDVTIEDLRSVDSWIPIPGYVYDIVNKRSH